MTLDEFVAVLAGHQAIGRGSWPVVLAGSGHLSAVTRGTTVDGERVVVLYVAEPEPDELVLTSPEACS